jgi:hypothetical protein
MQWDSLRQKTSILSSQITTTTEKAPHEARCDHCFHMRFDYVRILVGAGQEVVAFELWFENQKHLLKNQNSIKIKVEKQNKKG